MSTQKNPLSVQLAIKTAEVRDSLARIVNGLDGFTLQKDQDAARVDVLVLEIGNNPEAEFETIRALLKENVVGNLFLTSSRTSSDILLPALRAGAKEFFPQPLDPDEVTGAFQKVKSAYLQSMQVGQKPVSLGKIFSVLGAKGGVGTTTFAVNFATSIQALDKNKLVALIDMNRLVGEVPLFLDLEADTNWEDIGKNFSRLDAAYLQSAMARHSSGVYVMPAPSKFDAETHLPAGSLLEIVKTMRQFFDYIIVDGGMVFDDNLFNIFAESERVYLISILSLPCIINVRKLQESILSTGGVTNGKLRIIANRYEKKAQISLTEANKIIGTEISMTIPNDYALAMTAINNGKVIAEISKDSNVAKVYQRLAESVVDTAVARPGGFFNWFRKA
jgi:pilus assembly protein CpaE